MEFLFNYFFGRKTMVLWMQCWPRGSRDLAGLQKQGCSQLGRFAVLICLNMPTVCCVDIFLKEDNYYEKEKESRKWHVIYKIVSEKKYIPAWHTHTKKDLFVARRKSRLVFRAVKTSKFCLKGFPPTREFWKPWLSSTLFDPWKAILTISQSSAEYPLTRHHREVITSA